MIDSVIAFPQDINCSVVEFLELWDKETIWKDVYKELKPGGHVACFTKTADFIALGLRLSGFEFRDTIMYLSENSETILLFRKPLERTIVDNVLKHSVGGINIDGCRVKTEDINGNIYAYQGKKPSTLLANSSSYQRHNGSGTNNSRGRFPANIIHDGSKKILDMFPKTSISRANIESDNRSTCFYGIGGNKTGGVAGIRNPSNSYNASRFFYCAPSRKDLIEYIKKMITPNGGVIKELPTLV